MAVLSISSKGILPNSGASKKGSHLQNAVIILQLSFVSLVQENAASREKAATAATKVRGLQPHCPVLAGSVTLA